MRKCSAFRPLAALLALQIGHAWAGGGSDAELATRDAPTNSVRTVKERLSSKASDEQRVDNCKVPHELRGPKPRPDACDHGPSPAPRQ